MAKVQWHPAFCSAVRLELYENRDDLGFQNEYNLSEKPLQIDLLVIRKSKDVEIINEIGKMFKGHNIMEYKSPDDAMDIDVLFKVVAYGCLYKSSGDKVNSIKSDDITLSLVRERKPTKLFKMLTEMGYTPELKFSGVYRLKDFPFFDTQIIVSRELSEDNHKWLTALTNSMSVEQANNLVLALSGLKEKDEKVFADSILSVAIRANPEKFANVKEDDAMCKELMELMRPEFEAKLATELEAKLATELDTERKKIRDKDILSAVMILSRVKIPQDEIKKQIMEEYQISGEQADSYIAAAV